MIVTATLQRAQCDCCGRQEDARLVELYAMGRQESWRPPRDWLLVVAGGQTGDACSPACARGLIERYQAEAERRSGAGGRRPNTGI